MLNHFLLIIFLSTAGTFDKDSGKNNNNNSRNNKNGRNNDEDTDNLESQGPGSASDLFLVGRADGTLELFQVIILCVMP